MCPRNGVFPFQQTEVGLAQTLGPEVRGPRGRGAAGSYWLGGGRRVGVPRTQRRLLRLEAAHSRQNLEENRWGRQTTAIKASAISALVAPPPEPPLPPTLLASAPSLSPPGPRPPVPTTNPSLDRGVPFSPQSMWGWERGTLSVSCAATPLLPSAGQAGPESGSWRWDWGAAAGGSGGGAGRAAP